MRTAPAAAAGCIECHTGYQARRAPESFEARRRVSARDRRGRPIGRQRMRLNDRRAQLGSIIRFLLLAPFLYTHTFTVRLRASRCDAAAHLRPSQSEAALRAGVDQCPLRALVHSNARATSAERLISVPLTPLTRHTSRPIGSLVGAPRQPWPTPVHLNKHTDRQIGRQTSERASDWMSDRTRNERETDRQMDGRTNRHRQANSSARKRTCTLLHLRRRNR